MKTRHYILLAIAVAIVLTNCTTTETTTTYPDGRTVTTKTSGPDTGSVQAISQATASTIPAIIATK